MRHFSRLQWPEVALSRIAGPVTAGPDAGAAVTADGESMGKGYAKLTSHK